MHKKMQ